MGCGASADAKEGRDDGRQASNKDKRGRKQRRNDKSRAAHDDDSELSGGAVHHSYDESLTPSTAASAPESTAKQASNPLAAGPKYASVGPHTGGHDDDLSDISTCDLGESLLRAAPSTAQFGGKGLDVERAETEVNLADDFFTWDDAKLDLRELAKVNARKSMAAARNKTMLQQRQATAGAKTFAYGDFLIEDAATMDALNESGRGMHPFKKNKKKDDDHEASIRRNPSAAVMKQEQSQGVAVAGGAVERRVPLMPKRPPGDIKGFEVTTRIGHSSRVKCLAIAPGEREYVSCSNDDSIVTYYDTRTSQELGIYSGHQDTVIHAVFSPCGKYLATTSRDNTLMLWDVVTQKAVLTFEHGKVVICCAFSKSSRFIATGCQDKVCRLWECRRGRELVAFAQHDGIIISLSISPDESNVVSASADKTLRIWTVSKGKPKAVLRGHTHIILACNYNLEGNKIVSNDEKTVRVWSAPQGQQLRVINVEDLVKNRNIPSGKKQSWTLSCMAPKAFPRHFVVAANNRMVFVVDMETGDETLSVDTKAPVYCLAPGHRNVVGYGDSFGNVYFMRLECFDEEEPVNERPGGADWA